MQTRLSGNRQADERRTRSTKRYTHSLVEKEREKIEKYQDLRLKIQRMWNIKARVVPSSQATSNNLEKHLQEIPGKNKIPQLVKTAILGSAHILRKVLDLPESG